MKRSAPLARRTPLKSGSSLQRPGPGLSRSTRLSARSEKQAGEAGRLRAVYAALAVVRPKVCAGCGRPQGGLIKLSHSHLVPRSFNKALVVQPGNITYHCLDWEGHVGCHTRWESNAERHALLDFERNMAYIWRADPVYHRLLVMKTAVK